MDVDQLQKINNLARELMKHGMAESMDEAVRIAEEKIKGKAQVSEIKERVSGDLLTQSQVATSADDATPKANEALEIRKLKVALEDQAKTLGDVGGKINELISGFNDLQQEINRLKTIQVPASASTDDKGKPTQTQFRPQPEEKKKEGHARTGNYNPDDVSVEDVFYYGNK